MTASHIASVLGRLPSGLFILTARRGADETGMLASWIMQAGFDPPMITVAALHKDRLLARWLTDGAVRRQPAGRRPEAADRPLRSRI